MKWGQNKKLGWMIYAIIWAVVLSLPFIFTSEMDRTKDPDLIHFRNLDNTTNFLWLGFFSLNALFLIPRLFYKRKYILYTGSVILSFLVIMMLHWALFIAFVTSHQFNFLRSSQHNALPFIFTLLISTTYKIIYDRFKQESQAASLQRENLKTELSFLRSQISPHFLFNVLNNIVALVRLKSAELEPTVIKLSSLLQYMLYESDDEKVLLKNEVESLQNFIDLQKLRCSTKMNLQTHIDVKEDWHSIEPMLLIPFVENAFKHGNGLSDNPEIRIDLSEANDELDFSVRNKYSGSDKVKDKTSGIGLTNVKRRLGLLYPAKHQLQIDDSGGWYNVHLKLRLQ
jgi:sensor histidine kinase YesM